MKIGMIGKYTIIHGDVTEVLRDYQGEKFHAVLCDPPYHLTSITERFGKEDSAPAKYGTDGVFQRSSSGFMGMGWDGGDVAFRTETWKIIASVLFPGAFGMAFASSRGWHRVAVAIEDAGLIIHPSIFGWAYGSGFPKATRIDTQIDKAAGVERVDRVYGGHIGVSEHGGDGKNDAEFKTSIPHIIGKGKHSEGTPATPLAATWQGHRYGLQALKPALEPIIVFQKPYEGRPVECITETGAGALNIDEARIPGSWERSTPWKNDIRGGNYCTSAGRDVMTFEPQESHPSGRWPANFVLDEAAAARLDEMSESKMHSAGSPKPPGGWDSEGGWGFIGKGEYGGARIGDSGGASRFFFRYVADALDEADPVRYQAKASRAERDAGLEEFPKVNKGLPGQETGKQFIAPDGTLHRHGVSTPSHNPHPTIKPIDLTRYLATLLLPPSEYAPRRILVPFAGAGSEIIGALLAGWDEVVGIELEEEYVEIAENRTNFWIMAAEYYQTTDFEKLLSIVNNNKKDLPKNSNGQLSMF